MIKNLKKFINFLKSEKMHKTRNLMLIMAIVMILAYTIADIVLGFIGLATCSQIQLDSTLTDKWFDFWQWVVMSGAAITTVKTLKGRTNSDDDEIELEGTEQVDSEESEDDVLC